MLWVIVGGGGWLMSVWLILELKSLFGGIYFSLDDRYYGRLGFKIVLISFVE